ncbi:hypothetical protein SCOR_35380 [Sulfidibacter corallicola]|uniref:Uncharacterized protein n=1 Tax=Sulfidibacter corallicola TaxID=2818388 RepID=A0A8A4TGY7_SULCO|nr:hypothetical protein [Sulfidibacter corallicola]QTD49186.1 hypothetical protein J3U87_26675 [Sulfidibacter corallicola]
MDLRAAFLIIAMEQDVLRTPTQISELGFPTERDQLADTIGAFARAHEFANCAKWENESDAAFRQRLRRQFGLTWVRRFEAFTVSGRGMHRSVSYPRALWFHEIDKLALERALHSAVLFFRLQPFETYSLSEMLDLWRGPQHTRKRQRDFQRKRFLRLARQNGWTDKKQEPCWTGLEWVRCLSSFSRISLFRYLAGLRHDPELDALAPKARRLMQGGPISMFWYAYADNASRLARLSPAYPLIVAEVEARHLADQRAAAAARQTPPVDSPSPRFEVIAPGDGEWVEVVEPQDREPVGAFQPPPEPTIASARQGPSFRPGALWLWLAAGLAALGLLALFQDEPNRTPTPVATHVKVTHVSEEQPRNEADTDLDQQPSDQDHPPALRNYSGILPPADP